MDISFIIVLRVEGGFTDMALREVTVEVTAKYITKVIADNPEEAYSNARNLVMLGALTPCDTNEIILDVEDIT